MINTCCDPSVGMINGVEVNSYYYYALWYILDNNDLEVEDTLGNVKYLHVSEGYELQEIESDYIELCQKYKLK